MASEPLISGSVDSLSGLCGPALFPRTIRASADAPFSSDLKDLDSIHNFMKSLKKGSRSPENLLEEAKAIVDRGSELLNTNYAAFTAALGIDDAAPARGNEKPQERRPGLGRKRARFSLKPNSSQPSESLEPSLNIDQLQDPEEFFSAVEKLENAKKEIERQKGGSLPVINENNLSQNTRQRRPGLLGKSVTYKHRYSSVLSENEDTFVSSRESLEPNVPSAPNCESLQATDDSDVELEENNVAGSITNAENRVNKILDDLLSGSNEDLDGDGALFLLQERLHIKPVELSTLSMPDFPDIGSTDYKALGKSLSKPRKISLEVQNLVKRTSKETPINHKQLEESPIDSSPTPPRSPFASISLLKKRILQSNPLRDPFSPLNIDLSTSRNLSSGNQVDSVSNEFNGPKRFNISGKFQSDTEDGTRKLEVSDKTSEKVTTRSSDSLSDLSMDKNSSRQSPCVDVRPSGSHSNLEICHDGFDMDRDGMENTENDDLMGGPDMTKESVNNCPGQVFSSMEKHDSADYSAKSASAIDDHGSGQMEKNVEDMPSAASSAEMDINIKESTFSENLDIEQSLFDDGSDPATTKECTMGVQPTATESESTQQTGKHPSMSRQPKRKRSPVGKRERKTLSHRQSIADAGTAFENGVRKSKRVKMRPLEYWKGERFLYGRVNDSLKLIGLRYISPGKGDGKLKVKPLISDECNELLELAAKH